MAPLEFILALPLLLILTYLSFIVFVTFVEKFHGVTLVREATFEKVDFARPTEILKLSANPFNGETHSEFEHLLDWNSTNLKFDVQATLFANGNAVFQLFGFRARRCARLSFLGNFAFAFVRPSWTDASSINV